MYFCAQRFHLFNSNGFYIHIIVIIVVYLFEKVQWIVTARQTEWYVVRTYLYICAGIQLCECIIARLTISQFILFLFFFFNIIMLLFVLGGENLGIVHTATPIFWIKLLRLLVENNAFRADLFGLFFFATTDYGLKIRRYKLRASFGIEAVQ